MVNISQTDEKCIQFMALLLCFLGRNGPTFLAIFNGK